MNDEMTPVQGATRPPPRTSNRGPRREPPLIEGEAIRSADPAPVQIRRSPRLPRRPRHPNRPPWAKPRCPTATPHPRPTRPLAPSRATTSRGRGRPSRFPKRLPSRAPVLLRSARPISRRSAARRDVASAPAPAASPARGYGLGALAGATFGAAALAALAVFGLQSLRAPENAPLAGLEKRVADVEKREQASQRPPSARSTSALRRVQSLASGASESARKALHRRRAGRAPRRRRRASPAPNQRHRRTRSAPSSADCGGRQDASRRARRAGETPRRSSKAPSPRRSPTIAPRNRAPRPRRRPISTRCASRSPRSRRACSRSRPVRPARRSRPRSGRALQGP